MLDFSAQARRTGKWMVDSDGKKYWIQSKEEARRTGKWMVDSEGRRTGFNLKKKLKAIINDESKKIRGYRRGASSMIKNNKRKTTFLSRSRNLKANGHGSKNNSFSENMTAFREK